MATQALRDLFIDEVKDMYDAEQRLTRSLPKLAKAARSPKLAAAFNDHLKQTEGHVTRLERVLDGLDEQPTRKTCKAMVGLLQEGDDLMKIDGEAGVRDAALIAAAQKVEHYEMASYGCLRTWAHLLCENEAERLLQQTLDEEGAADKKLTEIAESLAMDTDENGDSARERKLDFKRANEMEAESPSHARKRTGGKKLVAKSRKH